ncbi:MAG: microcystin degradation protein MlrC [Candidatus Latescibacteria bacterium]|nr:microcystin degradation protein MlrC [Candidatus Latescibacterota bacterium]
MRIAIASYGQETSSFSPLITTLDTFALYGLYEGEEILEKCRDVGAIGGFMQTLNETGLTWTPVPLIHGWAGAHGPLDAATLDFFADKIAAGLKAAGPIDGFYFALHGAAQADHQPDTEGHLLALVRSRIGADIPLAISLDHHANLTQTMVDNCDALVAHRTQPHDQYETGVLAGRLLMDMLQGRTRPAMAWRKIPLITHQEQFLTSGGPMKAWFDLARQMENQPGVLSASTFPMQPWLDVPEGGWAVAVITDDDQDRAQQLAGELAAHAWDHRADFCKLDSIAPAAAIRRALAAEEGLVVLTDTGDSTFGGATGDSTTLLAEMLHQKIDQAALVPLVDAELVDTAFQVGEGGEFTALAGGKFDTRFGQPVEISARVAGLGGGRFEVNMLGWDSFDLGRAALLEVGAIKLLATQKRGIGGNHPCVYEHFGVDIAAAKMVVLKTASNWQFYQPWISQVIRCDTPGATMSHLEDFDWRQLPRPIYPLDEME